MGDAWYDVLLRPRVLEICSASQFDDMISEAKRSCRYEARARMVGTVLADLMNRCLGQDQFHGLHITQMIKGASINADRGSTRGSKLIDATTHNSDHVQLLCVITFATGYQLSKGSESR